MMSLEKASRETRLQWFARRVIDEMWQGQDIDGGSIQEWSLACGLIVPDTVTEENIDEIHYSEYLAPGDVFYRFSDDLNVKWGELTERISRATPPSPVPEGWVMVPKDKVLSALRGRANRAYCDYIGQMQRDDCCGVDIKISTGTFGHDNLKAHCKAHEHLGRHRALVDAENVINEMISAAPAAPSEGS